MGDAAAEVGLKRAFELYEHGVSVVNARRAALWAALFTFGGTAMDWVVYPEQAPAFLVIRAACGVLLCLAYLALVVLDGEKSRTRAAWAIPVVPTLGICAMIVMTGGGNSTYYAGMNLVMVGLSLLLRWSFRSTAGMVVFCFAAYFAGVLLVPGSSRHDVLASNLFFLFVTGVFVVAGSYYYEQLRFREFVLRKEVEDSHRLLATRNRQLSELDEAKTRFFANISHELRTPLTVIIGLMERMSIRFENSPEQEVREMLAMTSDNGLRLLKLIDDLLDLVRFDTGPAGRKLQASDPGGLVDGLMHSMRHLAEQNGVRLDWRSGFAPGLLMLDRDKLEKVILNLVINAIKFTPAGGRIEVDVSRAGERLVLVVRDTGVGIPAELLPRVFERFWQVDSSSTRRFQGAGIGLALVSGLVKAMGGTIGVESEVGRGTEFRVELPAAPAPDGVEVEEDPAAGAGRPIESLHRRAALSVAGSSVPQGGKIKADARPQVLVADDEADIRRLLVMQLAEVEVIEAADGAEALALARQHRPLLALLDHMMPEMNGVEVCRAIRGDESIREMPVILLTARADERTKLEALEAGASDFLTKPFSEAELVLRLRNQLAMAGIRRELLDLNGQLSLAMEKLKRNEVLLVRNEKLSGLGQMSAGIIHEINNPLNYARAGLHALDAFAGSVPESEKADFSEILGDVREGVERVVQIVTDLRQFTGDERRLGGELDLVDVIERSRRLVSHQLGERIGFVCDLPAAAPLSGNANQLVQVFVNLFRNAVDAIHQRESEHGGGPGRIEVSLRRSAEGWVVAVKDNGCGISAAMVPRIFDPFYTSKEVGQGTGLGLSITHQILGRHRARIEVASEPGDSTCFTMFFPTGQPAADAGASKP